MKGSQSDPISLAVYPLTSMMKDQVKYLTKKGVSAASKHERTYADIEASRLSFVFRSPE